MCFINCLIDTIQNNTGNQITYLELSNNKGLAETLLLNYTNLKVYSIGKEKVDFPYNVNYNFIEGDCRKFDSYKSISNRQIDIIFVSGIHEYFDVWNTFFCYSRLLKENSYVVFDNYNNFNYFPMIKSGVDHLVNQLRNDFNLIGTMSEFINCHNSELENFYIIQKKPKKNLGFNIPIAVNIATYRKNEQTIFILEKTIDSIISQTYKNYKIFLLGDNYDYDDEILGLLTKYPKDLIFYKNLTFSRERKFHTNKSTLWKYGGVNAANTAIDISLEHGYSYIAHMDHDDLWTEDHLQEIVKAIEITGSDFVCTRGKNVNGIELPVIMDTKEKYIPFMPIYNGILHSSVCINFTKIPLRYRDLWLDTGIDNDQILTGDSDMWERCRVHIIKNNLRSFCVNKVTVLHSRENK